MQLKLLNFHKMLANFSTSLVGGFIPLIIFKHTQSLVWSVVYLICLFMLNIIFNFSFRKFYVKYPQLILLLRAIPILGYSLCIILINYHFITGVILVTIFYALNNSFKYNSNEIILNYSTVDQDDSKGLGISRLFEQFGNVIALVLGGLFLDYLNVYILIIVAIAVYLISCIPLVIYYVKCKTEKGFNQESISNAYLSLSERPDKSKKGKKLEKKIVVQYFCVYFLFCFLDNFCDLFNLFMYTQIGMYSMAGYLSATYYLAYSISSYVNGYYSKKHDTTLVSVLGMFINGVVVMLMPFVNNIVFFFFAYFIVGFCYANYSIFLVDRLLAKTRILGISNKAIFARDNAGSVGKIACLLFALFGTLIPAFIATGIALFSCSALMPINEENTRKSLVNYLEGD